MPLMHFIKQKPADLFPINGFCHFNFEESSFFFSVPSLIFCVCYSQVQPHLTLHNLSTLQTDHFVENPYRGLLYYLPSIRKHQLLYDTMRICNRRTIWNMQITSTTKGARRERKLPVWLVMCSSVTPKVEFAIQDRHPCKTVRKRKVAALSFSTQFQLCEDFEYIRWRFLGHLWPS